MDIALFGIQGSGKGTQAKKLAEEYNFALFEAGAELRGIAASDTDLGRTVKGYIDEGHLVPQEIIVQVVRDFVHSLPEGQKILFDGFPRDFEQAHAFDDIVEESGRHFLCVHITLSEEKAFERIKDRADKEGRADDIDEESVRRRMGIFTEKTMPVIDHYQKLGRVQNVDGDGTVNEVYERIKQQIA